LRIRLLGIRSWFSFQLFGWYQAGYGVTCQAVSGLRCCLSNEIFLSVLGFR
jgi:hypothetical protein